MHSTISGKQSKKIQVETLISWLINQEELSHFDIINIDRCLRSQGRLRNE